MRVYNRLPKTQARLRARYQIHKERYKEQGREHYKSLSREQKLLNGVRNRARLHGYDFNLTLEDIIIPEICPILGIRLKKHLRKWEDDSPSLDRIDNSKGYIKDNVWVISRLANIMKNSASLDQLRKFGEWAIKQ